MTGARHSMYGPGQVKEYVKDGLICWWDGIDNAGPGLHSSNTRTWKNLGSLGASFDATRYANVSKWSDKGAVFDSSTYPYCFYTPSYLMSRQMKGEWTAEVVCAPDSGWFQNYRGVAGQHVSTSASSRALILFQYGDMRTSCAVFGSRDFCNYVLNVPQLFQAGTTVGMSVCASATGLSFDLYHNGSAVTSSTPGFVSKLAPANANAVTLSHNGQFLIGAAFGSGNSGDRCFSGTFYCCRIYSRPLTAEEVLSNHRVDVKRFGGFAS